MRGFNNEAWITSVLNDDEVAKALTLATGLKLSCTNRWLSVVVSSTKTSAKSRDLLVDMFDFVFPLEEERNKGHLKMEDFAKICAIRCARSFRKCVYVAPGMMPVKNCDEIFDLGKSVSEDSGSENFSFLENMDPSIFVFKPSKELGTALMEGLANYRNGVKNANFLKMWIQNNSSGLETRFAIPMKFNRILESEEDLEEIGNESEICIVNWGNLNPCEMEDSKQKKMPMAMKLAVNHWKNIQRDLKLGDKGHSQNTDHWKKEPIAIVGMSCRYPNANNLEEFWNLLLEGGDGTGKPPEFRWLPDQSVMSTISASEFRKTNAGFLKVPVDEFDAKFFGISPKEMVFMDPQHRLLHEIIWESLEDAAIDPNSLKGSLGAVYLGSWLNDYKDILINSGKTEFYRGYMGNSIGAMAARISHFLGLTGPSIATESGCSSAMVAVHLACNSLQKGETNLAVAGGVNLLLRPFTADMMPMVISPDGHCKTFDEGANGFARAEGCGVMVLKRLSDAVKDGDRIWALIRGTGISQEGTSKSMGTPTVHSESLAMEQALEDANVRPEEISYVEAHGTGTVVGDPLEVAAIAKVYHSKRRSEPLVIGSVKANVGHTESCSGITGIMKVVLSMVHETIPPQRNLTKLNPNINLESVPATIPLTALEWRKSEDRPRLAGVSSFGITGTDAHAIIEESPDLKSNILIEQRSPPVGERKWNILKISAKTEQSLEILLERYKQTLEITSDSPSPSLEDICFTANTGRSDFQWRAIITGKSKQEMVENIKKQKYIKEEISAENSTFTRKVCFLFTGQGSQYPGMARNLYETSLVFRMHFDQCCEILQKDYEIDIKNILWSTSPEASEISRTIYSQTSIFCVEYALSKLWESLGVTPDLVLGHSLGEFAAAVAAGILSVRDALRLVAERSILIDKLPTGKMLVIKADHSIVSSHMSKFGKILDFAAINSAEQTVVAGDSSTILEFAEYLKTEQNVKCLVLEATHAFHSRHMDPMLDAYREVAQTMTKYSKKINKKCLYVSGLRGKVIDSMEEVIDPQYWVDHTREKVMFLEASKAVAVDCELFIEIGPQPILSAMTMMNNEDKSLTCLPSLKKNSSSDWEVILGSLGNLYLLGFNNIDWAGLDRFRKRRKVPLPHYPFIGKKFWPEMNTSGTGLSLHPLLGTSFENPTSSRLFQCGINLRSHEYIKDHVIGHHVIFPGAGYLEMCLAAGMCSLTVTSGRPIKIENLCIEAPLELLEDKTRQLHTVVELDTEGDASVKIFQKNDDDATASSSSWLLHSKATFCPVPSAEDKKVENFYSQEDFQKMTQGQDQVDELRTTQAYEKLASLGLRFGPSFRSLDKIWKSETQSKLLAKVKALPEDQHEKYIVHPVVIDAMIQTIMMLKMTSGSNLKNKLHVPIKIGRFVWLGKKMTSDFSIFACGPTDAPLSTDKCTAILVSSEGHPLAIMSKVEFIDTTVKAVESVLEHQTNPMPQMWEEVWRPQVGTTQHRANLNLCNKIEFSSVVQPEVEVQLDLFSKLEQFCILSIMRALFELGWAPSQGESFLETELFEKLQIHPNFRGLFSRYMDILEMDGLLEKYVEKSWKVTLGPKMSEVDKILNSKELTGTLMNNFQMTPLYMQVSSRLCDILRGRVQPESVLFPDSKKYPGLGDFKETYNSTFGVDALLRKSFGQWLEQVISGQRTGERFILRILEIGTGSEPDRRILELFEKFEVEFQYTFGTGSEIENAKSYNKNKNVAFATLDLDLDPVSQGFIPEYFDLIIMTSNLGATGLEKDIQRPLRHLRTLLRCNGRLDILGYSGVNVPLTYLFGLIGDVGALSSDKYVEMCGQCGFGLLESTEIMGGRHSYFSVRKLSQCNVDKVKGPDIVDNLSEKNEKKIWLLFDFPGDPLSSYLCSKMESVPGRNVICVRAGTIYNDDDYLTSGFQIRRNMKNDFLGVMDKIEDMKDSMTLEGIVYCWSLDDMVTSQNELLQPYFYLLQTMYKGGGNPRLITLTRGATNPVQDCDLGNIHTSTILGVTKSFLNERSEFKGKCLDISGDSESDESMLQVFYEIWKRDKELQVSFGSGGHSYVPKLVALKPNLPGLSLPCGTDRYQLTLPETKSIHDLKFSPLEPFGPLGDVEVEVQIKASALNFKDVLNVIKPTDEFKSSNSVGFDYAGVIKRVGSNVTQWSVGDRVFGVNYNGTALPSHTKQHQDNVIPVPDGVTFCDAATLPAVFSTAYHCLVDIAKITKNDTVLIHAASGGVGLVAIQICKNIGCSIICTAGSNRKRNFLKRNIGIQNVFHSRNTEFQDKIMEVTKGHGVTVVLNSLTSEGFKEASLKCCSKGARFIEMSKLKIWTPQEVRDLRPDVFYRVVDLTTLEQPEATRLLKILSKMLSEQVIDPIPTVRFDAVKIREALQYLQKAKHIGKVMVMMPEANQFKNEVKTPLFNNHSTYLITGGLGGIGFTVCKWMVQRHGACWVILAGRRSPGSKVLQEIDELNKIEGVKVRFVQLDVSDFEQCQDLLESKISEMGYPALRGIMHCAGTLHDGLIDNQVWDEFSSTFTTKIQGTLNLHELTRHNLRLEHFVLFSSMAANFGSPGQGNHTAGNLFEDTMAHYRHSLGLPAISINWGQWGEVGIATEVEIHGVRPFSNQQALQGLEFCMRSPQRVQTSVVNIESFLMLNKLIRHCSTYLDEHIWRSCSGGTGEKSQSSQMKSPDFWRLYDAISKESRDEKFKIVRQQLKNILRNILKLEDSEVIGDDANFQEMGVDSLMFVEMKNYLQALFGDRITVNASAVRDCDTVGSLAATLVKMIEGDAMSDATVAPLAEEVAALIREDSQLPDHIRAKEGSKAVEVADIKVVMITGVTGTLGPYILKELTAGSFSDQLTKVICLVRPQRQISGEERLQRILKERDISGEVDMSRVTVVNGNVALPNLGLEESKWSELIDEVDAVFHCAALVQHVEHYRKKNVDTNSDMRAVNNGGTKNILEFVSSGSKLKPLFHCSTMFAASTVDPITGCLSEKWPEISDYDGVTTLAYQTSKFVCDMLLKEAVHERGITAKVCRFPLIFGDSRSGRFVLEQNHAMLRYLFILKNGVMPSNPFPMMLLPVDLCASIGVKIFFDERFPFNQIYNICHPKTQVDQEFVEVAKRLGHHVDIVEFAEFAKKVIDSTEEDSPFAIFKEFYRDENNIMSVYVNAPSAKHWLEQGSQLDKNFFVSEKIMEVAPEFYEQLKPAMEYVYRDFKFAKDAGWLEKYGL